MSDGSLRRKGRRELMDINSAKSEVIKAGNELVKRGLVARTWGNVSCRIDENTMAITPSGIAYDRLDEDCIVVMNIDSLEYNGEIKPSSEKGIHATAYRANSQTNFVIHTHQTYATIIGISGFSSLNPIQELDLLGGEIGVSGYGLPGTKALRKAVSVEIDKGRQTILMKNHGALLLGRDMEEAFNRAALLEDICKRAMDELPKFNDTPAEAGEELQDVISEIRKDWPDFTSVRVLASEAVDSAMKISGTLPAVIDDFAQIVGGDLKIATKQNASRMLKGRNAVLISGVGALCCAGNESDCHAVLTLVEKNALAFLNAKKNGDSSSISFFDKKLMRYIYLNKYSKQKLTGHKE